MDPSRSVLDILDQRPIDSWAYPRVLIGILPERTMSHMDEVFYPFMQIASQGPAFLPAKYGRTDVLRNQMVLKLLESSYTHLLMLDVDHKHPEDIVQRLIRWHLLYGDNVLVTSGMNFRRKAPFDPVMGIVASVGERPIVTEWDSGLMLVDECGAASLMVHRYVFEAMEPPWFANIYDDVWENNWPGEDIYFARKCKEHSINFYVDTTTSSPHANTHMVDESTFRTYMKVHPKEFSNEVDL